MVRYHSRRIRIGRRCRSMTLAVLLPLPLDSAHKHTRHVVGGDLVCEGGAKTASESETFISKSAFLEYFYQ